MLAGGPEGAPLWTSSHGVTSGITDVLCANISPAGRLFFLDLTTQGKIKRRRQPWGAVFSPGRWERANIYILPQAGRNGSPPNPGVFS